MGDDAADRVDAKSLAAIWSLVPAILLAQTLAVLTSTNSLVNSRLSGTSSPGLSWIKGC